MKRFISISILVLVVGISSTMAQSTATKVADGTKKDARAVGNKTAEVASKAKSGVVDKVYKDKKGPDGQTIYINKHSKYYYIDKKGHDVFIAKNKLVSAN
jgi:hypothetical protein